MRETAGSANPAARRARILIVDPDPGAREALSHAVTGSGHTVCAAVEPGSPALDLLAGASPELALIGLEGSEGAGRAFETARQVAERFGIPLIYATETTDAALLDRAQRTHPHGYVLKSGDPRQLGLAIRAALGMAARADQERHARQVDDLRGTVARSKRVEAELHQRVQVLDAIIRSMGDGVVVADAEATIRLFNPSAERILGIGMTDRPRDEWTDLYGVFYPDRSTPVPTDELPLVRAVRGEAVEDEEFFIRNPSVPAGVYLSVTASPVRDESREVVGGVSVLRDVSERKMEQEALSQAFAHGRLEVIDVVLHNIGNAINSVATGMDTLHERYKDLEVIRRFNALAKLVSAHDHDWTTWLEHDAQGRRLRPFLLALIRDLNSEQELVRKTATRVRDRVRHIVDIIRTQESVAGGAVAPTLVKLRRTISDAVTESRESLGRRGVAIEVDCSRAPTEILVQESRFRQMLVNLLKNAMEAVDERAVRLENDPGWQPTVRVAAYRAKQAGFLVIDVVDNGIGIDPSRFRAVFNAGYTTKANGSGLGLHSAANFAIGSGGTIQPLSDGIGHGTTMRVTLRLPAQQVI